jgi:hypothetical protein
MTEISGRDEFQCWAEVLAQLKLPGLSENFISVDWAENRYIMDGKFQPGLKKPAFN